MDGTGQPEKALNFSKNMTTHRQQSYEINDKNIRARGGFYAYIGANYGHCIKIVGCYKSTNSLGGSINKGRVLFVAEYPIDSGIYHSSLSAVGRQCIIVQIALKESKATVPEFRTTKSGKVIENSRRDVTFDPYTRIFYHNKKYGMVTLRQRNKSPTDLITKDVENNVEDAIIDLDVIPDEYFADVPIPPIDLKSMRKPSQYFSIWELSHLDYLCPSSGIRIIPRKYWKECAERLVYRNDKTNRCPVFGYDEEGHLVVYDPYSKDTSEPIQDKIFKKIATTSRSKQKRGRRISKYYDIQSDSDTEEEDEEVQRPKKVIVVDKAPDVINAECSDVIVEKSTAISVNVSWEELYDDDLDDAIFELYTFSVDPKPLQKKDDAEDIAVIETVGHEIDKYSTSLDYGGYGQSLSQNIDRIESYKNGDGDNGGYGQSLSQNMKEEELASLKSHLERIESYKNGDGDKELAEESARLIFLREDQLTATSSYLQNIANSIKEQLTDEYCPLVTEVDRWLNALQYGKELLMYKIN